MNLSKTEICYFLTQPISEKLTRNLIHLFPNSLEREDVIGWKTPVAFQYLKDRITM